MNDRARNAPIGMLDLTPDGTVRDLNPVARELLDLGATDAAGESIDTVFPESVEARVPGAFETPPERERSFDAYYPDLDRWLDVSLVPDGDTVYLYLRDRTEQRRTERQLADAREDVDRLTVTSELIADVLGELVAASTRAEIAETICAQLGETALYEFAWVGERAVGSDDLVMRAAAGVDNRTLDRIADELDGDGRVPERRAIESGEPETVQSLGEADAVAEPIRRAAFADGVQSLLAVPLTGGESVHGVVGVYASDRDAFSERERRNFGTVGEMAGFAVTAARNRSLLSADRVVELTFSLTDSEAPLVAAAEETETTLSVTGLIPDGDRLVCYLDAEGDAPRTVEHALDGEAVLGTRVVAAGEAGGSLELILDDSTPLGQLVGQGATLRTATYDAGEGRIVVELPPAADVRRIADAFTRVHHATVVAKRERRREATTVGEFRDALGDRLTDRQENVLRTAFFADYFESPRGSTAEEVAEALGITGPTLLHHLRAGQRKLLDEFFETTD
ncbi:bacterio-opsin activator domain-containing protein [Halorientalis pallida]|uniref:Histidine kinase n=1 Tax=Halorientalis pallida TaxID=2479928 RepID=A0A498KZD7_9EURY|nr:bacterio-opsin activator domain-containing protein [Halorientalis pallida]RXK51096.1 histidine kinase [Halorientalis pallida]